MYTNKLIKEKSPYLLQHAYNPVDWYPWGEEAFAKAQHENKPIFLSIGYSTCHWCHVMERESFEDEEVSSLLNKYYISIKVDREERPDVDHLYMQFCQALTGSGGWPLTIILTPEKQPFFAGTYFPKTNKYGRSGLLAILDKIGSKWRNNDQNLRKSAQEIVNAVKSQSTKTPVNIQFEIDEFSLWALTQLDKAYHYFVQTFDQSYGGFGHSPKFPSPHNITFLLRYAHDHPKSKALKMVETTLNAMSMGGIYDHIGYGFARYSTDRKWLVPHFEKMLYDNALLAIAYLECYQTTKKPTYTKIANQIFEYILRDMTSQEGGFYSAEDADSEGVEGKFYVWTLEEIGKILEPESLEMFCRVYDITQGGNYEHKNIPNLIDKNWEQLATEFNLSVQDLILRLEEARQKIFQQRKNRINPHKDDKILSSWNALMIVALAKGAQILDNLSYLSKAIEATEFILSKMRRTDGRLLARYREGESAHLAYLDDYAFLIWALLEIYTVSGQPHYLQLALELQEDQDNLFSDSAGGYFLTGLDAEELLFRPKDVYDGALPSGNSVSALNLLKLSRLTADPIWEEKAFNHLMAFRETLEQYPSGYGAFMQALQFSINSGQEVILAGALTDPCLLDMKRETFKDFHPYISLLYQEGTLDKWVPWLKEYSLINKEVTAYVCQNFACQKPITDPKQLHTLLN